MALLERSRRSIEKDGGISFEEMEKKIGAASFDQQIKLIAERRTDPYSALDKLMKALGL